MDDLINIIIKFRWEIAGALAMSFIVAYLADLNNRKSISKGDIKEFTDVFGELIQGLQPNPKITFKMKEVIKHHERAAIDLRTSLDCLSLWRFNRYWKEYQKQAGNYDNSLKQLGRDKANHGMLDATTKFIAKVKRL